MSTRCQVIITDGQQELWFYRHSDGYPETTYKSLMKFLSWALEGRIRYDDVMQAAGWLIMLGNKEYKQSRIPGKDRGKYSNCKVGAYEPCLPARHGDIEYLYTVDLFRGEITYLDLNSEHPRRKNTIDDYRVLVVAERKRMKEIRKQFRLSKVGTPALPAPQVF